MIRRVAQVVASEATGIIVEVPDWPGHRPGQFAMLTLDPSGETHDPLLPRPMAIYRAEGARLEFRFKPVGRGTRLLGTRSPGASLGVVGPLGNGFPSPQGRPLLVGGGTGIASLLELATACGPEGQVLLGGRTRADVLGLDEFEALPAQLDLATEDGSAGHCGLVTDLLKPGPGDEIFACGPTPMLRRVHELAREGGAPCWVSLETHMACGFGVCLGCAVRSVAGFRLVCTDGPVFAASDLDWDELP